MDFFITGEKHDASFYGEVIVTRLSSFMEYYGYTGIKPEDFFRKYIFLNCEFSFVNDWGYFNNEGNEDYSYDDYLITAEGIPKLVSKVKKNSQLKVDYLQRLEKFCKTKTEP